MPKAETDTRARATIAATFPESSRKGRTALRPRSINERFGEHAEPAKEKNLRQYCVEPVGSQTAYLPVMPQPLKKRGFDCFELRYCRHKAQRRQKYFSHFEMDSKGTTA